MCTLIVTVSGEPGSADARWSVAANRDEQLDRPAEGPAVRPGDVPWFGPLDRQAGGTWIGVGQTGLLVAITNRYTGAPARVGRSRGQLVLDALGARDLATARRAIGAIEPAAYNPFHLVVADRGRAALLWSDGQRLHDEPWDAGTRVVTERSFAAAPTDREPLLEQALRSNLGGPPPPPPITPWAEILRIHAEPSLEGVCVHAPHLGYGTRSSTVAWLGDGEVGFWHASGPPCETDYVDHSAALAAVLRPAR